MSDDVREKLKGCFRTVFPSLSEAEITTASAASVAEWDSLSGITLLQVIEQEFQRSIELQRIAELDSFDSLAEYLSTPADQPL